jgi:TubC N-terminal docking domain
VTVGACLDELLARGVTVVIEGEDLVVVGPAAALTDDVVTSLRSAKHELLAELGRRHAARLAVEVWRDYFEERAAIREYEGGFSRTEAELLASKETVEEMLSGQLDVTNDLLFRERSIAR